MEPNTNVETALLRAIQASRLHDPKSYPRPAFYASSLGQCPRKQVCERLGMAPTNPPDSRSQFKMWTGTVLGKAIQTGLEGQGYCDSTWHEKLLTYRNYVGKVDGYNATVNAIIEIKTTDDDAITKYPEMPEHYLLQGLWYCLASNIPNLIIFQIGKNQGLVRNRHFTLTDEWKDKLEVEMDTMQAWWADYERLKVLPDHVHHFKWEDRLCPFVGDELAEYLAYQPGEDGVDESVGEPERGGGVREPE